MATNLLTFSPAGIRASTPSTDRRPDQTRRRTSAAAAANWWAPILGWSSEPDYIDSGNKADPQNLAGGAPESDPEPRSARARFTEAKARQLRLMTKGTDSFHDAMYHSAIASRLASDFENRTDF